MSIELQKKVVREIAESISSAWDRATVNIEIDDVGGEIVSSEESTLWRNGKSEAFGLTFEALEYLEELRASMARSGSANQAWTICNLEILNDGTFKFDFSYSKPPRLSKLK